MSDDRRRATRYAAFFESADKAAGTSKRTKSPGRKEARKSPARVENIKKEAKRAESPVKKERKASKSPARGRKASKSPARNASKGRKPSKSPARVPKKEKPVKEEKETKKAAAKTKNKVAPSIVIEKIKTSQMSPKSKKAVAAKITEVDSDVDLSPRPRRRTRQDTAAEKKSASASVSRSVVDASPEYSDHDDPEVSFGRRRTTSKLDEIREFGGPLGCAALLILYPLLTYYLQYVCSTRSCNIRQPNWSDFKVLGTYYSLDLLKIVLPFVLGVAVLNIFPLGRVAKVHTDRGYAEFQHNGLTLSLVTLIGIVTAEYLKYPVVDVIYKHSNQLLLISLVIALAQSILVFVLSRYTSQAFWNPFAKTGNFIHDFFVGREISPKLGSLVDIKLVNYHLSLITTLVLNGIFIYKNLKFPVISTEIELKLHEKLSYYLLNAKVELVPLIVSGLIIIYVLDLLIFEHHMGKTFELQYEGVGADLLLRNAIFPFNFSLIAKYALEYRLKLQLYVILPIALVFCVALVLKRIANSAKHDFRQNPTSAKSLGEWTSL